MPGPRRWPRSPRIRELQRDFAALCDFGGRRAGTPGEARGVGYLRTRVLPRSIRAPSSSRSPTRAGVVPPSRSTLADGTALACNALARFGNRRRRRASPPKSSTSAAARRKISRVTRATSRAAACWCATNIHFPRCMCTAGANTAGRSSTARRHSSSPIRCAMRARCPARRAAAAAPAFPRSRPISNRRALTAPRIGGQHARVHLQRRRRRLRGANRRRDARSARAVGASASRSARMSTATTLPKARIDNATGVAVVLAVARAFAPLHCGLPARTYACVYSAPRNGRSRARASISIACATSRARCDRAQHQSRYRRRRRAADRAHERIPAPRNVRARSRGGRRHGARHVRADDGELRSLQFRAARHSGAAPGRRASTGRECNVKHILTRGDTRDKVAPGEMENAARLTAALLARALTASDEDMAALRQK